MNTSTFPIDSVSARSDIRLYAASGLMILLCTLAAILIGEHIDPINLVMIYLLGVVFTAAHLGRGPSILACVLAVSSFNFFFVQPYYSFSVTDNKYYVTFIFFVITSLIASSVTVKLRLQTENTRRQNNELQALYNTASALTGCSDYDSIAHTAITQITSVFAGSAAIWLPYAQEELKLTPPTEADCWNHDAARWAYFHQQACGTGTQTFPSEKGWYLPLNAQSKTLGVLAIESNYAMQNPVLLAAYTSLLTSAISRTNAAQESQQHLHESERQTLRNTLLSAVGHDLRTPLAAITGAASALACYPDLPQDALRMAASIEKETSRLNKLVHNILEVTRLEAGALSLRRDAYFIPELVGSALERCKPSLKHRHLHLELEKKLPLLNIDGVLIEQVLINLLENAARYTADDKDITIRASVTAYAVEISVSDSGPGITPGNETLIFERYKRLSDSSAEGMGLGLAICKAIVEAHGGNIWVNNRPQAGATFTFTLPLSFNKAVVEEEIHAASN